MASYTAASQFISNGSGAALQAVVNLDGSTTNLIFDVHQYLDSDNSGTNSACVTNNIDTAFSPLATWLRSNKRQAILTETGGGNVASCATYLCQELNYLKWVRYIPIFWRSISTKQFPKLQFWRVPRLHWLGSRKLRHFLCALGNTDWFERRMERYVSGQILHSQNIGLWRWDVELDLLTGHALARLPFLWPTRCIVLVEPHEKFREWTALEIWRGRILCSTQLRISFFLFANLFTIDLPFSLQSSMYPVPPFVHSLYILRFTSHSMLLFFYGFTNLFSIVNKYLLSHVFLRSFTFDPIQCIFRYRIKFFSWGFFVISNTWSSFNDLYNVII